MAAGDAARAALLQSSPELQRALERTGAREAVIVVRDLAPTTGGGSGSAATTSSLDTGSRGAGAFEGGAQQHRNQHAGTRAGIEAMDGSNTFVRSGPGRSARPAAPARSTGVDLTM
jgi:hypothetical protein